MSICNLLLWAVILLFSIGCDKHPSQFQGYIESEDIFLSSPYSGVLKILAVKRGQQVKKGQLLFELDPNPEKIKIQEIQSKLKEAQQVYEDIVKPKRDPEIASIKAHIEQINAKLRLSQLQLNRFNQLYEKQAISKSEVDIEIAKYEELWQAKAQQEANLKLASLGNRNNQIEAQQEEAKSLLARLRQAQWELAQKTVFSPADGVVFDTYYQVGEFVPNQQAVASLLIPENVRVEFFIPEKMLTMLSLNQAILIKCENCTRTYKAVINYISPQAEYIPPLVYSRENSDKLVFRIKASLFNPKQFKPGQPVTVSVDYEH